MSCLEARQWLSPYFDHELEPTRQFLIEEHLEICGSCREVFRRESQLEGILKGSLVSDAKTQAAWTDAIQALAVQPAKTWSVSIAFASIAIVGLCLGSWIWIQNHPNYAKDLPNDLEKAAFKSHEKYLGGQLPLQVQGVSVEEIERFIREELSIKIQLPREIPVAEMRIIGARPCHLAGVPVAYIIYQHSHEPVSVFAMQRKEAHWFQQLLEFKSKLWDSEISYHKHGQSISIRSAGDLVVIVAGYVPEEITRSIARAFSKRSFSS